MLQDDDHTDGIDRLLEMEHRLECQLIDAQKKLLMRLNKASFRELLNEPLVQWIGYREACTAVQRGARWLDVRLPSEHQNLSIEGSINIPLYFIRLKLSTLERSTPYIVYCDTGRRSSAAAFILVERGFDAHVLRGGLDSAELGGPR